MQLRADALAAHLAAKQRAGALAAVYTVSGDEPLLVIEAADAIRAAARAAGFNERTVLHADARFDWSELAAAASGLSLFAGQTLIDLRLPTGKPGRSGGEALATHATAPPPGTLTLVTLPRLDGKTRKSGWAAALDAAGVWVEVPKVDRDALPRWLRERLAGQQQSADSAALEFIADRVEGNLLAAQQELAKLALLYPSGELALEQVTDSVTHVARFDVFSLAATILSGKSARALRQLEGLRAEGAPLPLVLWTLHEEVRTLVALKGELVAGKSFAAVARSYRVWGRESLVEHMLARTAATQLADWLARCATIEKLAKGLRPPQLCDDAWVELMALARDMANVVATPPAPGASRSRAPAQAYGRPA